MNIAKGFPFFKKPLEKGSKSSLNKACFIIHVMQKLGAHADKIIVRLDKSPDNVCKTLVVFTRFMAISDSSSKF